MNRISAWLRGDLKRVRILEREVAVKRVHLSTLILVALIALVVGLVLGFAGGFHYPYKTVKPPAIPKGQTTPNCPTLNGKPNRSDDHALGQCLPQPKNSSSTGVSSSTRPVSLLRVVSITRSSTGPDFSNNNPVSCSAQAAIAARNSFEILKVNEGTGFVDRTAAPMASCAKTHGLTVGGYDFLHICLTDPAGEARVAVAAARADGLLAKGTLPLTGDSEYPSSPQCNVRAWISTWVVTVHSLTGRWPTIYTGAWWWNPHVGAWWYGNLTAWVSGYVSSLSVVPRPAGRSHIDLWQASDRGFNGATSADLSIWEDGARAFAALAGGSSTSTSRYAVFPTTVFRFGRERASERNTARTWDRSRCRNPVRRPVCKSTHYHLVLLQGRLWFVAHHRLARGICVSVGTCDVRWVKLARPRWSYPSKSQPLGSRFALISRRLAAR